MLFSSMSSYFIPGKWFTLCIKCVSNSAFNVSDSVVILQIFQGLDLLCNTLKSHQEMYQPLPEVQPPMKAIRPMVSGIQAHSVTTILSPIGQRAVVQLSVRYSTTETHEVIWAYNVLGHMIPVEGRYRSLRVC